jgi:ergothioneine biosynthesis protein EgtB
VQALLAARPDDARIEALVMLGLQHEQQHQELLLTDIKHALSFSPRHPPYAKRWPMRTVQPQPLRWFDCEGGLFELGHDAARDGDFCFDNETPRHRAYTAPFAIASRPASYGEWLAFIDDDGYRRPELWLSMGWDWLQAGPQRAPLYWRREGGHWLNHTLQGEVEIDEHSPVCHLSYFEADAFARWAGARLPTEAEWERAAGAPRDGNFVEEGRFHPSAAPAGTGLRQLYGDVWEWTASPYTPYPGFQPAAGAVGEYNGKFMCNQFVLRGGSCATSRSHIRSTYRNFFPPEATWQFTGVRLARDAERGEDR